MSKDLKVSIADVVSLGLIEDVKRLIKVGYNLNEQDQFGNYPVTIAASRNDTKMVHVLLEAGADGSVMDDSGMSASSWATFYKNQEMINIINSHPHSNSKSTKRLP